MASLSATLPVEIILKYKDFHEWSERRREEKISRSALTYLYLGGNFT
jgi:hypothetical protein